MEIADWKHHLLMVDDTHSNSDSDDQEYLRHPLYIGTKILKSYDCNLCQIGIYLKYVTIEMRKYGTYTSKKYFDIEIKS